MTDKETIRARPRQDMEQGAVTDSYRGDPEIVIGLLNEALATEIVCQLRYKRHYFTAQGIAARIVQLGGEPNFNPKGLASRSHAEYVEGKTLTDMIKEDLVAERIAIDSHGEMIRFLGDVDITSRRLLEKILEVEEEHAEDLASLIQGMPRASR
jgi:bacterioferritin